MTTDQEHSYASTQIHLPKAMADKVIALGKSIPDDELAEDGRETDPHITVKYGLHHDSAGKVKAALAGEMPPKFELGSLSMFPANEKRKSDALISSVYSPDLHRLNKAVSSAAPHIDTHDGYSPHVTIAYLKPGNGMKYVGRDDLAGMQGMADTVIHSTRDGTKTEIPLTSRTAKRPAMSFSADGRSYVLELNADGEGKAIPLGLEGLPTVNDAGEPIHYRRQLIARCRQWTHRGTGEQFDITRQRADEWMRNTAALAAAGVKPFLPGQHRDRFNAADNFGFVERIERDGDDVYAVVGLHGDDALKVAARNGRSVYVVHDAMDADGKVYPGESLHHLALVPNPALPGLGGTLKIAASADGAARDVPVFVLSGSSTAAPRRKGSLMTPDIAKKARETFGLGADIPDDKLDDAVATKALALSADLATLKTERDTLKTERDAKAQEVLSLSDDKREPDGLSLSLITKAFRNEETDVIRSGALSEAGVGELRKLYYDGAKPTRQALALSAGSAEPLYSRLLEVIRKFPGMKSNVPRHGEQQAEPLSLSDDEHKQSNDDAEKQAREWKERQLAARGLK